MKDVFAAWRDKPWIWATPLAFVAINVLFIVFFQAAFSGQVEALRSSYDRQAQVLETLQTERHNAARFVERLERQESSSEVLYGDYFATEGERFIAVLREIRSLAREAGMDPQTFAYPEQTVDDYGLNRRGIRFGVDGTYDQLRRFINLLELTDQFITLEAVRLGDAKGGGNNDPKLSIRLSLSTIFIQGESPARSRPSLAATDSSLPAEEGALPPEEGET